MIDPTFQNETPIVRDANVFSAMVRDRQRRFGLIAWLLSFVLGALYVFGQGNVVYPLALVSAVTFVTLMVLYPGFILPFTLAGACIFELTISLAFTWPRTDQFPLFWNTNTIMQRYAGMPDFHAFPLSPFELLLVLAFVSWFLRCIMYHEFNVRLGALFFPILGFVVCVVAALGNGLATGGNLQLALMEVRALIYFFFAYIMAVNGVTDPKVQTSRMLWITAICISIKAIQATIRYFGELHGSTIPEIGIGSHEESFFFNIYGLEYMLLWMAGLEPKLRRYMLIMWPLVILMNLANQRRAATAALILALPAMMILGYVAFANRRKVIVGIAVGAVFVGAIYFPLFWNKTGTIAQPARAVKSQFSPDARDLSSNVYRDAEDANLFLTMQTSPLLGFGYGKPFLIIVPMVDLSDIDPLIHIIPHNSVLWVWMRTGTVGFFMFWLMVSMILIYCAQICRTPGYGTDIRFVAIFVCCTVITQLVFGLLDMQLSNIRNMLFMGVWLGTLVYMRQTYKKVEVPKPEMRPEQELVPQHEWRSRFETTASKVAPR